jgi:uncharacterized RDD family membrane protein YckC
MPAPDPVLSLTAPGLRRRLACLVYEGVLLFGILMVAGLVYGMLTQQRHALVGMHGLQFFLFLVLGSYFTWFWSHGGQTVAMKTWHIRLLTKQGHDVPPPRAALRYLLSWLWFMPALVYAYLAGLKTGASIAAALAVGAFVYAAVGRVNAQRQCLHDLLSGTRLVYWKGARATRERFD